MISIIDLIYFWNWVIGICMLLFKSLLKSNIKNFHKYGLLWLCRSCIWRKTFSLLMCTTYAFLFSCCLTHCPLYCVGGYYIWLVCSWHHSCGNSTLLLLKFHLPICLEWLWNSTCHWPLWTILLLKLCVIYCVFLLVLEHQDSCPLRLHVIIGFYCRSLLEYDAVYSGSHVLMFHGSLIPSESPFSETLLHI